MINKESIALPAFMSPSADHTKRVAAKLAALLGPPLVFALQGDLGAGKTTFVQGLVDALAPGQIMRVQSPTFALAKSYATRIPVHHLDLYRLSDNASLIGLGIEEMIFAEDAYCLVEWPERYVARWPLRTIQIKVELVSENERSIQIFLPPSLAQFALPIKNSLNKE